MREQTAFDKLLRDNHARVVFYLFTLALVLRVVYLCQYARSPFFWVPALDSLYNDNQALAIVHGHAPSAAFWRAPLYSYFLAGIYSVFGHNLIAARVIQELLGCASCCLTYAIGLRAMRPVAALIGAAGMAFYGPMIFNDGELQSPALEVFLDLLMLLCTANALHSGRTRSYAAAGLLLGLSAIVRPTILLILPLVVIAQWRARGPLAVAGTAFIACALIAPILVTARNAIVAHDPVFIASQGGINLFAGNHDGADGFTPTTPAHYDYDGPYQDAIELYGQRAAEEALRRPLKASEVNAYWTRRTIAWWTQRPATALKLACKKLILMWTQTELRDNVAFDYVRKEWTPILWVATIGFWLAGPLGLAGMAAFAARLRTSGDDPDERVERAIIWLLAAFVLVTMTSFVLFFAAERFRLPVVPALLLLAGLACTSLKEAIWSHDRRRSWGLYATLAAGCLLVNIPWYRTGTPAVKALDYWSCGNRYKELNRFGEAASQYRLALRIDPRNADIWQNLGAAYYYAGDAVDALTVWRTANQLVPSASGYYNLGECEETLGMHEAAKRDLRNALRIDPGHRKAQEALAAYRTP
ncbi:MAG: glycosyltransferase family 39 protein [Capsulimonadaceae bacterium]|nr:glycosyltransferase family 39 protein [Capsulimonadaceae bacterium]